MDFLDSLYSITGSIITAFYLPQLYSVWVAKTPLKGISLITWFTWSVCMVVSFSYAFFKLQDTKMAVFQLLGAFFCFVIFATTAYKRYRYRNKKWVNVNTDY